MKKFFTYFALTVFLIIGCYTAIEMSKLSPTFNGEKVNVVELYNNPSKYENNDADGVANLMVKQTIDKTHAINAVTAIVFDFRGYDTLGESFVLFTAISGTVVILRNAMKGRAD
ncbi:hydrogen gas-evolving membrane-bound hydrogenase subunit E [Thermobrachium celere]|uniref:MrpA C-terminal/MbhE domain-containing protein n=1 Tax=Thermobrachium celere DSM 8682 TaxID=941824 RepID=R7RPN3_9CLOT|nr:hydrogen gas-evolving membrane-bound hydrogenase subunit E [Thermobrachium celere]GFR36339.1 hypothetical protein TCEA9_21510 [Thermobrachium celere]CDF58147.1 hypothetical protein TCEL_00193 [Thermobrachium celere DSM 8682]